MQWGLRVYLHLCIGPPGDLHHDVEGVGLAVCYQRNVVERRNWTLSILDEDLVAVSVLLAPLLC